MIVGVAGPYAAGKGEVVGFLEDRGYQAHSLSDVIREVLSERGLSETRERMIETGRALRQAHGTAVLAERLVARFRPSQDYVIDSIRHPAEVEALRAQAESFTLVWVDAPLRLRFERLRSRGRPGDPRDTGELASFEARERGGSDELGGAGQQLEAVEALADHRLSNDGDLGALHRQLQHLMQPLDGKTP
jgi:dephospho-CoA kinase